MRRSILMLLVAVAALAAAAPAAARFDVTLVVGHGALGTGPVVTVSAYDVGGSVGGFLRVDNGGGFVFVSRVRCVRVVGDRVLVGGVIVRSPTPATLGHTSMIDVEDGGFGNDRLGIAFSSSGLDSCPDIGPPLHDVVSGDFLVLSG